MKSARFMILPMVLLAAAAATGAEPAAAAPPIPGLPDAALTEKRAEPWIGLEVSKLNDAMRAQVSAVPVGVGFVITGVAEEGPAAAAGLRRFDILWRFEDQLLVNEAQFGTLIRMKSPGDTVALSIIRAGSTEVVDVEIGRMPERESPADLDPSEIPIFPAGVPGMPRQIVYHRDRTAEITRRDGSIARLRYEGEAPMVRIENADGEVLFDGPLKKDGRLAIPDEWRCTVGALLRTMHRSRDKDWHPRSPRPRVVVPPGGGTAGD